MTISLEYISQLSFQQICDNANTFLQELYADLGDHPNYDKILSIYTHPEYEKIWTTSPASSTASYHNAFYGGYVDHVRRVVKFTKYLYSTYDLMGINLSGFTLSELLFAAYHHDLGKLGYPVPDGEMYKYNNSEWHRKHQGKLFSVNDGISFMLIQHRSLFILQKFGIVLSENEYMGIMTHDGLFDEVNDPYYLSKQASTKLRTKLPIILHQADYMAAQVEYDNMCAFNNCTYTSPDWKIN